MAAERGRLPTLGPLLLVDLEDLGEVGLLVEVIPQGLDVGVCLLDLWTAVEVAVSHLVEQDQGLNADLGCDGSSPGGKWGVGSQDQDAMIVDLTRCPFPMLG